MENAQRELLKCAAAEKTLQSQMVAMQLGGTGSGWKPFAQRLN
ncbi:hypothetical protein [Verrucomicrobium sp. 3C]|nr:hypothetical protein [Verrucomicrobium sp. 3C]